MAWITKRPCRISRNGTLVLVPPGNLLPEANDFKNPSMWCVWSADETKATVEEKDKSSVEDMTLSDTEIPNESPIAPFEADLDYMPIGDLRKLAKEVQNETKDFSSNLRKANKDELLAIIRSIKKG